MVDPNRKVNKLSADDTAFLAECEQIFQNRYTGADAQYAAYMVKPDSTPPIVDPWPGHRTHHSGGYNRNRNSSFNRATWNDSIHNRHHNRGYNRYSDRGNYDHNSQARAFNYDNARQNSGPPNRQNSGQPYRPNSGQPNTSNYERNQYGRQYYQY